MGTDCGRSFMKLMHDPVCTGVNHNPQMKIAPSERCLWEEEKKKTHDTQHSLKSRNYEPLQVGCNKKTGFYVGRGNVTTQNPLPA